MGKKALEYLGVLHDGEEAQETLEFHSTLLAAHLAAISDVAAYHLACPWRVVAALCPQALPGLLKYLKSSWEFCTSFVDGLSSADKLYDMFNFTRYQPYRDLMVKAEHLT